MGVQDLFKKFGSRSKKRSGCHMNEDGSVTCKSEREFEGGEVQKLADFTLKVDANCRPAPAEVNEYVEGELAKLEAQHLPRIIGKCKSKDSE